VLVSLTTLSVSFKSRPSRFPNVRASRRYLEILAIQPEYQGNRLGPRLLDHHLALIDDAESDLPSAPAWLESSPEAERLYRSRGFEDVGKVRAEGWRDGFPAMLRPRKGVD
jgi:GNAT superfamily N-acetyltransferase